MLGRETIDTVNSSDTRGGQRSYGLNYQKLGKALMTPDELAVMDNGRCILQVQGVRPFFSDKYDMILPGIPGIKSWQMRTPKTRLMWKGS